MTTAISKLVPPAAGFDLFGQSPPTEMDAFIHFRCDMSYGYQEGYRRAFEVLVDYVQTSDRSHDLLIYPILFVARQHIELSLKSMLRLINLNRATVSPPKFIHDLAKLWQPCKDFLLEQWPNDDHEWLAAVDSLTSQLTQYDERADAFRFAILKKGGKSLEGVDRINIQSLFEIMNPIMRWLSRVEAILVEMNDADGDDEEDDDDLNGEL